MKATCPKRKSKPHPTGQRADVHRPVPVPHGGIDLEELARCGLDPDRVLDFSANINPLGPSPGVRRVLAETRIDQYPDPQCIALRRALGDYQGVSPDQILPGNGASELIWLVALALLRPGDNVLVLGPTYGEYCRAAALMRASGTTLQSRESEQFKADLDEVSEALQLRPRLIFLCNPNNPTGTIISPEIIQAWARRYGETVFVVDEAYAPFVSERTARPEYPTANLLVLRSMTKDFGLAGLRLGYALGPQQLIGRLREAQPPWSVNAFAQAAGVVVLEETKYYQDCRKALARAKTDLLAELLALNLRPVPSQTPFFLLPVRDGRSFRQALLRHGIVVRDCTSFGLPGYVRIATGRPQDNARLVAAIRQVQCSGEAVHAC